MSSPKFFITGIPTAGKSYLAKKMATAIHGIAVSLDDYRESLRSDGRYKKWIDFYVDHDEEHYLKTIPPEEMWKNLVAQSETLWPAFLQKIARYDDIAKPVIFECVNILPYLAKRDLRFPGIVLIGHAYEEVFERNKANPRWGATPKLQEMEAKIFFEVERPHYKAEAQKYGYPIFESADEAFEPACKLMLSE